MCNELFIIYYACMHANYVMRLDRLSYLLCGLLLIALLLNIFDLTGSIEAQLDVH